MSFADAYLTETRQLVDALDRDVIERLATGLAEVRDCGGRLFILGVGGSAAHASHAVNDFRKLCGFEAYCPTDNVSELTARTNDEGFDETFSAWLLGSRLTPRDGVLVYSVGGGDAERRVSTNIVKGARSRSRKSARRSSASSAAMEDTPPRWRTACVIIPPLFRRADHAPHGGSLRGDLAPSCQPSVVAIVADAMGIADSGSLQANDRGT